MNISVVEVCMCDGVMNLGGKLQRHLYSLAKNHILSFHGREGGGLDN